MKHWWVLHFVVVSLTSKTAYVQKSFEKHLSKNAYEHWINQRTQTFCRCILASKDTTYLFSTILKIMQNSVISHSLARRVFKQLHNGNKFQFTKDDPVKFQLKTDCLKFRIFVQNQCGPSLHSSLQYYKWNKSEVKAKTENVHTHSPQRSGMKLSLLIEHYKIKIRFWIQNGQLYDGISPAQYKKRSKLLDLF